MQQFGHRSAARAGSTAGRATGSSRMKAEGRGDQVEGDTKMAGAKIKDASKK